MAGFYQNINQCTRKGKGGEDFRLVNMDMNLAGLELQHEQGKAFNMFVTCVWVCNNECKHNFCLTSQGPWNALCLNSVMGL